MSVDEGRKVTIDAIAREAGVPVPTVSRVLSDRSAVPAETRDRVEALLSRYGYQPEPGPQRALVGLVDVVFDQLDEVALRLTEGVERVAGATGTGMVVSAIGGRFTGIHQWLLNVRARTTDGLLLAARDVTDPLHLEVRRLPVPIVCLNPAGPVPADVSAVGSDEPLAGRQATDHLLALGHRQIGCIASRAYPGHTPAAVHGYRTALAAAGVPVRPELVRLASADAESGFAAATILLQLDPAPTAVFATSDEIALGAGAAVRERGLRVPQDVSVVGLDDLPAARWAAPALTTVRRPFREMGLLGARTLLRLAHGEPLAPSHLELATELVVRDSTARPPAR
ncbi:MAG TPA: LacI family DNA-binding transcriptional regulator [Micromonosporaceae bacterium]